ncbi:MAG TPA: peptidylprolyl isomerase [Pyrinomonadaceae bacterium]
MRTINRAIFSIAVLFTMSLSAFAQESETKVVDEVVAQVNDGVITLSRIKREAKTAVDSYVQEGKTREEAQKMVDAKQGELIAGLINEELLMQKAKELGLDSTVEGNLNQRFLEIMKQQNLKTLDQLYQEMEKGGIDPQEIREVWRKQATRDAVLQREVSSKIYWGLNSKEMKDYYEKNKTRFTKPETVELSEIFLSFAGREPAAVREKAKQIAAQLKAGGDFQKLVAENSDRPNAAQTKGKVGKLNVSELDAKFAAAIKSLKTGGVSDPIELDEVGIEILRVDDKTQASSESVFDENAVRIAITTERAPAEQKKYMADLRQDSYIKINDTYRPLVAPILFADERKTEKAGK